MTLPVDRLGHLGRVLAMDLAGLTDEAIFDALATKANIEIKLDRNQKLTVVRRMGGKKKWQGYGFEDLVLKVLTRDQRRLLALRTVQRQKRTKRALTLAERADVADSLLQPVTRLAAQAEHLTVLAGLPASHFYRSVEWKATRADALRLAGYRCEWCGATAKQVQIEVDHIVTRIIAPERAFDLGNLRVLCKPCHDGRHAAERGVGR